jgi:ferredoxin
MPVPDHYGLFIDPGRCIGCRACVQACGECETHKGLPMIHLEYLDRAYSTQTMPTVCMHCESPTCAEVCPADAIKKGEDGIVRSALKGQWRVAMAGRGIVEKHWKTRRFVRSRPGWCGVRNEFKKVENGPLV